MRSASSATGVGLARRDVVRQAVGVLMFRYGLGSYEALAVLARWAHEAGVSLPDLAVVLMSGVCLGRIGSDDPRAPLTRWLVQRMRSDPAVESEAGVR